MNLEDETIFLQCYLSSCNQPQMRVTPSRNLGTTESVTSSIQSKYDHIFLE